jgi:hypothetical protein
MNEIVLTCFKQSYDRQGLWRRKIVFPCFPFPGLEVGSHKVVTVSVCQGDLDGEGEIQVHLDDAVKNEEAILEGHGWRRVV